MTHEQPSSPDGGEPTPPPPNPDHEAQSSANPERPEYEHPAIWIGSLADYNNGDLHGDWMDATRDDEDIHAEIQRILAGGPAARRGEVPEEWGIFDHQGFGPLQIGVYDLIEEVSRLARAIAEHGPAFAAFASGDLVDREDATVERFQEVYLGRFDSVVDYARQLTSDLGYDELLDHQLPNHVRSYVRIDYEQFAQDLQVGGDISCAPTDDGGFYLFRNE